MPLHLLPSEVLYHIFDATTLEPRWVAGEYKGNWHSVPQHLEDIKRLRLTCRQFHGLCTDRLFQSASLYPEKNAFQAHNSPRSYETKSGSYQPDESDPSTSVSRFTRLLNHTELRHQVHNVVLSTSVDGEEAINDSDRLSKAWRDAVSGIWKFSKLSSIQINFRKLCLDDDEDLMGWVTEDEEFREDVLRTVLGALNKKTSPANNLRSLTIINLQNKNKEIITDSSNFKKVLSTITELHLLIAVQIDEASPESYVLQNALYEFFSEGLREAWLKPASQNITHLTLYTNMYWGWVPGFDPRGIRFPSVRYLALGNYTFAHDWQIGWIISHFADLETLIMVDCPILFHMHPAGCLERHAAEVSHEDHIKLVNPSRNQYAVSEWDDDSHWTYNSRWHHFFPQFEAQLLSLTKFVYTHEGWPTLFNMEQAFDERDRLLSSFQLKRYAAFNGTIGPSQWEDECDRDGVYENFSGGVKVMTPAMTEPPYQIVLEDDGQSEDRGSSRGQSKGGDLMGCQKQDEEAFYSLLKTVARRAREKGVL